MIIHGWKNGYTGNNSRTTDYNRIYRVNQTSSDTISVMYHETRPQINLGGDWRYQVPAYLS